MEWEPLQILKFTAVRAKKTIAFLSSFKLLGYFDMAMPYRGRGGWGAPGGRGGPAAAPMFQAKRWVKPGTAAAAAASAAETAAAAVPASSGRDAPSEGTGHLHGGAGGCGGGGGGASVGGARKWVKGQGVSGPKPVVVAPPPERGRLSVYVGNLDPNVTEDNLWRFFGQAGRVNRSTCPRANSIRKCGAPREHGPGAAYSRALTLMSCARVVRPRSRGARTLTLTHVRTHVVVGPSCLVTGAQNSLKE